MNNDPIDTTTAAGASAAPSQRTRVREVLRYTDTMGVRPVFRITEGFAEVTGLH